MLLLTGEQLNARRIVAAAELLPLRESLARDLEPLLDAEPYIPAGKALLSRVGGRCETDGTDLEFDPFSPQAHRCPSCARMHTGEWHDRWWLYPYQLWLAERAVHAAALHALRPDERHANLARAILTGYADRYLDYPNRDNVLGPSRLFFSTYLESLWLLHISIAADLLGTAGDAATAERVRERIVAPAVQLIEEYHEGTSNRQVWNNAAIVAARSLLGEGVDSPGIAGALADAESTLLQAVGVDGSWYEGDNYHQFAHRGMWYLFALGERLGYEFQATSVARFNAGFAAPFRSVLPDFTYPARKDSRYGASLRQWRFAESCELGIARAEDPLLNWALTRMYADDIPPGDTGRSRSSGEAERHVGPVRLSRADLGWRSLLFARVSLPGATTAAPASLTIASQGLTIHRRDEGTVYVALDWGESGGGHGHPDRLNLIFSHGDRRWLDDLGTGSYVDRSLHWYRSTLAHNAPMVGGASQLRVNGELLALAEGEEFDVVVARAEGIAAGVRVERTLMTAGAYFIDEVRWWAPQSVRFELPVHFVGEPDGLRFLPAALTGAGGVEDGFDFVHGSERAIVPAATSVSIAARRGDGSASATFWSDLAIEWFRARAPGQPASTDRRFHLIRQHGTQGVIRSAWTWRPDGVDVRCSPSGIAVTVDDATDRHEFTDDAWRVQTAGGGELVLERPVTPRTNQPAAGHSSGARGGDHGLSVRVTEPTPEWYGDAVGSARDAWRVFDLGEEHYRRSELDWEEAGRPRARVALRVEPDAVIVEVFMETPELVLVPADAVNPLDNEHPDINGHGVQVYFANDTGSGAWVIVPERPSPRARVRRIAGWGTAPDPVASWREVRGGFELRLTVPMRAARGRQFAIDLIVNDAETGRVRRRGQLVTSGAGGEFVYLRGDRHDPARLIPISVT